MLKDFDALIKKIRSAFNKRSIAKDLEDKFKPTVVVMTRILDDIVPRSDEDPLRNETPGVRLHNKSLADSLEVKYIPLKKGGVGKLVIELDHPTIGSKYGGTNLVDWLILGTKRHDIPNTVLDYKLHFWWGHPLRWPAKDGKLDGPRFFVAVDHPGVEPQGDFIKETYDGAELQIWSAVDKTFDKIMLRFDLA